ncbi:MAG: MerR family transcriptional regulator [Pseudohongiellaceae bacterium]
MNTGKRIGEAATLTGLSAHALRQWHRRYDIGPSFNSGGGQRRYSDQDIERIQRIDRLRQQGFSLATLAEWPLASLKQHTERNHRRLVIGWTGRHYSVFAAEIPQADFVPADALGKRPPGCDAWVVECPTLTDDQLDELPDSREAISILFYEYANRRQLTHLEQLGYECHKGKPTTRWFLDRLSKLAPGADGFSLDELTALMNIKPSLNCECPNHLAGILRELTFFAQYSLECAINEDKDAELHQGIFRHVQTSQRAVLSALQSVVLAERLDVRTLPSA